MALPELFANPPSPGQTAPWAFATLATAVSTTPAAGTVETWTISQAPPASLAQPGQFRFVIDNEVCTDVTGGGGTARQVQRGADGSTVAAHGLGASLYHNVTHGSLNEFAQSVGDASPLINGAGQRLVNIPAWRANTLYPSGFVVQQGGIAYAATATFTSGASFGVDTNWTPLSSAELGYAQITSTSAVISSATPTLVTGLSTTVLVGSRPIYIEAFLRELQNASVATAFEASATIFEDGVQIAQSDVWLAGTQFAGVETVVKARRNPAAGSHTYDLRVFVATATTDQIVVVASATGPSHISVVQA